MKGCLLFSAMLVSVSLASAQEVKGGMTVNFFDRDVYVRDKNYDKSAIGPYTLEDPLTFLDGRKVRTAADWAERRREILGVFAKEMYGAEPPAPEVVVTELEDEKVAVGGFAIRRQYRMWFKSDKTGPCVHWVMWLPRHAKGPSPVILFLNYRGNYELVPDPDLPVPDVWVKNSEESFIANHRPNEKTRGSLQNPDSRTVFPIGTLLARGYAVMSACYAELSPDPAGYGDDQQNFPQHRFCYSGLFDLWGERDPARMDDVTALGAWGWALSRGLDLAERIREIDAKRSLVTGCSRLAKAALVAAARDERFAVCVPIQTGGGGVPLMKREFGENVSTVALYFSHWFCRNYAKYARDPAKTMPFDQHLLLSCLAPRALLVEGFDDPWYDTEGEYLAVKAASPVWKLLGKGAMPDVPWPDAYDTSAIGRDLGYVRRTENHGMAACDWHWMLDFADGVFGRPAKETSGCLRGAIGEKADRLFKNRLTGVRGRGDIFEETVKAFRTRYDDLHPTAKGETKSGYWQGEYWGKGMLSHCAYARYSGDAEEKAFIHRKALGLVAEFQKPDGYLATYDNPDFVTGWTWNVWSRKYTLWALVEAWDLTKDERLLAAAVKMVEHLDRQLKRLKVDLRDTGSFAGLPSMSILKPLVLVYERTKNRTALELARAIVASNDRADGACPNLIANAFSDKPVHTWYPHPEDWAKAYEFMSVVEGFIAYSRVTGEQRPLEAAKRIFDRLVTDEMNGVCSVGYHDHFVGARACPNTISESCDVIHWMRLCRFLYQATGEDKYLGFWERAFYNAFLAGVFRDGKWATHDVRSHGRRHLQGVFEVNMYHHFCCIANDPRAFVDWADLAVEAKGENSVDLNFLSDGVYELNGATIAVTGNYPVGDRVTVRVSTPKALTLRVRKDGGRELHDIPSGGGAFEVSFDLTPRIESWTDGRTGDPAPASYLRECFEMPMHNKEMVGYLRDKSGVRVLRGPLVLAKCALAGACDGEILDDLRIDETWTVSLEPKENDEVWGCWDVTFEKDGVRKTVSAADYSSAADFDDWRNAFSIWF